MDPESYDMETNFLVSLPGQPGIGDSPGAELMLWPSAETH